MKEEPLTNGSDLGPEEGSFLDNELPKERYDLRILSSFRRIIRSVDIHSKKLASEYGVTVPQLLCLLKIQDNGSLTLKELSDKVFLNSSTLVGVIDRLEKIEVVTRERSKEDRRKIFISLTDKGEKMVADSPSPLQESMLNAIDDLAPDEKMITANSLEKILNFMIAEQEHLDFEKLESASVI